MTIKILELFSGYGTATFALKRLGIEQEVVGYSDIDKYANQCFQQNHGGKELGDVKLINPLELPEFDLLTGGFPCQAFSVAGKRLGEADPRGTLFYEIIRIAEVKQPKYMLLENVKGLTNKTFKATFDKILSELDRIGYNVYWKVLNTQDYGIPQSRARVWFVCFRKDIDKGTFQFPQPMELKIFIKDILEPGVDKKYFLSEKMIQGIMKSKFKERQPQDYNGICKNLKIGGDVKCVCVHSLFPRSGNPNDGGTGHLSKDDGTSYCIDSGNCQAIEIKIGAIRGRGKDNHPNLELRKDYCSNSIISSTKDNLVYPNIRRLTPKECFRLQGFLNDEINLEGLSDTQKYKLAGNGQSVNVVALIFKEMFK